MILTATNEQIQRCLIVADVTNRYFNPPYQVVINVYGAPGGGKTMGGMQYGESTGKKVCFLRTGHRPVTELEGVPDLYTDEKGHKLVRYITLDEFPNADDDTPIIVIIDEIDRQSDEQAVASLCGLGLDGILGSYRMPKTAQRMTTMNGITDDGTLPLPKMARQRLCHIYLSNMDSAGYVDYLNKKEAEEDWTEFIKSNWTEIQTPVQFEDLQSGHNDYRRNIDMARCINRAIKAIEKKGQMQVHDIRPLMLQGYLGFRLTAMKMAHEAAAGEIPTLDEIKHNSLTAKVPNVSAFQMAAVMMIVSDNRVGENGTLKEVANYVARLRRDVAEFAYRQVGVNFPQVYATEAYLNWANK